MQAVRTESPGPSRRLPAWSTTGWAGASPPSGSSDSSPDNSRPPTPASPRPAGPRRTAGPPATGPSAAVRRATREIPTLAVRPTPALSLPVETTLSVNVMVRPDCQTVRHWTTTTPGHPHTEQRQIHIHIYCTNVRTTDTLERLTQTQTEIHMTYNCIVIVSLSKYFLFSFFSFL